MKRYDDSRLGWEIAAMLVDLALGITATWWVTTNHGWGWGVIAFFVVGYLASHVVMRKAAPAADNTNAVPSPSTNDSSCSRPWRLRAARSCR